MASSFWKPWLQVWQGHSRLSGYGSTFMRVWGFRHKLWNPQFVRLSETVIHRSWKRFYFHPFLRPLLIFWRHKGHFYLKWTNFIHQFQPLVSLLKNVINSEIRIYFKKILRIDRTWGLHGGIVVSIPLTAGWSWFKTRQAPFLCGACMFWRHSDYFHSREKCILGQLVNLNSH